MSDRSDEVDDRARSVPLPGEEGDYVVAQQNTGPSSEDGSGEWASPQSPPTGPAPGTTPEGAQAASRRSQARPAADRSESFDQALGADPVAGGSQSTGDDDQAG